MKKRKKKKEHYVKNIEHEEIKIKKKKKKKKNISIESCVDVDINSMETKQMERTVDDMLLKSSTHSKDNIDNMDVIDGTTNREKKKKKRKKNISIESCVDVDINSMNTKEMKRTVDDMLLKSSTHNEDNIDNMDVTDGATNREEKKKKKEKEGRMQTGRWCGNQRN